MLVVLVAALLGPPAASATPIPRIVVGVNANNIWGPEVAGRRNLPAMRAAGVQVVRNDFNWNAVQRRGDRPYDWSSYDAVVADLARHGMRLQPVIDYSPAWAASIPGEVMSPPADMDAWAAFAAAGVARYGENGQFWRENPELPKLPPNAWEIWNEPNLTELFWKAGRQPAVYADLLQRTANAIHAVDPGAIVAGGSLMSGRDPIDFLRRMIAAQPGLVRSVDTWSYHPYGMSAEDDVRLVGEFRTALDQLGMADRPIDITEFGFLGYDGAPWGIDQDDRARMYRTVTLSLSLPTCRVRIIEPYTWTSPAIVSDSESFYGLANYAGELNLTGKTFFDTAVEVSRSRRAALAAVGVTPRVVRSKYRGRSGKRRGTSSRVARKTWPVCGTVVSG